jgi:hypothetical protein
MLTLHEPAAINLQRLPTQRSHSRSTQAAAGLIARQLLWQG